MSGYFGFLNCKEEESAVSKMEDRWGNQTMGFGFTGVPNLLLRINALDETKGCERVSSAEMFVLLVILGHWVKLNVHPYPGIERIACHTGLSKRHVRRIVGALVEKGYLTAHRRGERGVYNVSYSPRPLIERLSGAAKLLKDDLKPMLGEQSITKLEIADRLGLFSPRPQGEGTVH